MKRRLMRRRKGRREKKILSRYYSHETSDHWKFRSYDEQMTRRERGERWRRGGGREGREGEGGEERLEM